MFTHGFMSFASVTIIIACLIVMGSFTLLDINVNQIVEDIGNQNQILAYVDEDMTAQEATAQIQTKLEALDNVASVNFVSRSEARQNFLEKYDESYMEGLNDEVFRHRFVIQLVDLSQMDATKTAIENVDGIDKVNAPTEFADKFISVRNVISIVSLVLIAILGFVSLFIMSNTIINSWGTNARNLRQKRRDRHNEDGRRVQQLHSMPLCYRGSRARHCRRRPCVPCPVGPV